MCAPVLRIEHRDTDRGAPVGTVAGDGDPVACDGATLGRLPELVASAAALDRRVVIDCGTGGGDDDGVESLVAAVWALGCGADVVTDQPGPVALAASVLPPSGPVGRW